jgi:4-hydroxybenzoate polyprenyltransferase
VTAAAMLAAALFAGSLVIASRLSLEVVLIVAGYLLLNVAYSIRLKHWVIVDAFCIAFGFILRMAAGGEALKALDPGITISTWIVLCTLLGSLFLAFCKRRNELGLADEAGNHRATLSEYSTQFLDQMIAIATACTVMAYALWTIWPETVAKFHTQRLFWTVPFVCYGIFRYLYLVHQKNLGGSPSKIFLSDPPLIVNILAWILAVIAILYGPLLWK